jgi:hypothetical protein
LTLYYYYYYIIKLAILQKIKINTMYLIKKNENKKVYIPVWDYFIAGGSLDELIEVAKEKGMSLVLYDRGEKVRKQYEMQDLIKREKWFLLMELVVYVRPVKEGILTE